MFITVLMGFFFSKLMSFIFLGKICSQNLKFFKMTEILYRGRLLFPYFDFDVYFFKIFAYNFGQIWSSILKLSKLIEICYRRIFLHAYYDVNV